MNKYKLILFDLDDTLLDFQKSSFKSLVNLFDSLQTSMSFETFFEKYFEINKALWSDLEKSKITQDEIKVARFERTFSHFNLKNDPHEASQKYLNGIVEFQVEIPQAKEIVRYCKEKYQVGIITNGIGDIQRKRLQKASFKDDIEFMVVSSDLKISKPDVRIFNHTLGLVQNIKPHESLMIGDSHSSDVIGGLNAKMSTCWISDQSACDLSTYQINKLGDLRTIV